MLRPISCCLFNLVLPKIIWHLVILFIGKDPDAGRDWGQEEKGTAEDEMAEWHHQLDGHEFESTLEIGDGHGSLACCHSWGRKELDTTEDFTFTFHFHELEKEMATQIGRAHV